MNKTSRVEKRKTLEDILCVLANRVLREWSELSQGVPHRPIGSEFQEDTKNALRGPRILSSKVSNDVWVLQGAQYFQFLGDGPHQLLAVASSSDLDLFDGDDLTRDCVNAPVDLAVGARSDELSLLPEKLSSLSRESNRCLAIGECDFLTRR